MPNRASKMWRKFGVGGAELCSIFAAENGLLSIPTADGATRKDDGRGEQKRGRNFFFPEK